jgi:hypothetical protein
MGPFTGGLLDAAKRGQIPHEVVSATADGATPSRAWREYLGLKSLRALGISQPACSQQEAKKHLSESSREKMAAALGIAADQLDF